MKGKKKPAITGGAQLAALLSQMIADRVTEEMTQEMIVGQVAGAAGVDSTAVSMVLSGETPHPDKTILDAFAMVLGVEVDGLVEAATADGADYSTGEGEASESGETPPAAEPAPAAAAAAQSAAGTVEGLLSPAQWATRNAELQAVFRPFGERFRHILDASLASPTATVESARQELLTALGKQSPGPLGGAAAMITTPADKAEKYRKGAMSALMIRAGMKPDKDMGNELRGYTLLELARRSLEIHGIQTGGMDKRRLVGEAFTHASGDFTNVLADVANKAMLEGYEDAEETFDQWTQVANIPDFKSMRMVDLGGFNSLRQVRPGAEYKYVSLGDQGEVMALATYGELFSIDRQAIINDDQGAFTDIPMAFGAAARATVGDLVYAILTGNPLMADNVALFHPSHNNLLAGGGITTAAVDAMRVAMGTQTRQGTTRALNLRLAHLLVPLALQGIAEQVRTSQFEVGASAKNNTVPNYVANTFDVISDYRLDADSSANWYGAAANRTIRVGYLDGQSAPFLDQRDGWGVDGVEFKVRMDATAKAVDYRTLAAHYLLVN
jgi:transcriptional regulator with XRE-family HTH domain